MKFLKSDWINFLKQKLYRVKKQTLTFRNINIKE